ncbi:MAG: amidohydrolase family protein [Bryobacteraceae bacterium]
MIVRIGIAFLASLLCHAQTYDLVLRRGRVLDPATRLDAVRDIGIRNGAIAAISDSPLSGAAIIDASGKIVAPGFIDLHAHGQDEENQRYQVRDGVTTALELEIGTLDVAAWYNQREGKRIIHSGVSVGHPPARIRVMNDPSTTLVPTGDGARKAANPEQITLMKTHIERGLREGALGVGFGIQYTPAASREEILEMFKLAARFSRPAFVHIRHMGAAAPDALTALQEVIANAAVTGAPVHVVHITSSGLAQTPVLLDTISLARRRGMDITTECYPYEAAMTELQSAMFDPGWQNILGITFDRVEWVATGERLTPDSFDRYRKLGGMVIMHMIPGPIVEQAVAHPLTMIASDGVIEHGKGHPRGAGTFARVLGHFVRERQTLSLLDAVSKMSFQPAQRAGLAAKGRISRGADADLVVFDPVRVSDHATFRQPTLPSEGIDTVLVSGVVVVENGRLREGVLPGKAVRMPRTRD